jgi:preprotein translocase subunit SecD
MMPATCFRRCSTVLAGAIVLALGYGLWARGTTPVFAAVRFEIRVAEDRPTPGLMVAQVAESNRLVYLHPEIVVSNDDIAQSSVSPDGPEQFAVAVQFLPSSVERLRQATAAHVGRPVAILIDGRVLMTPIVRSPIEDSAVITGTFARGEAERIADGIGRR